MLRRTALAGLATALVSPFANVQIVRAADTVTLRVGNVPIAHPPDSFWSGRYFELPSFTPPPIDPHAANGIPHLGLDRILVDLIGDRL